MKTRLPLSYSFFNFSLAIGGLWSVDHLPIFFRSVTLAFNSCLHVENSDSVNVYLTVLLQIC